jgi:hypothetical protein
LPLPNEDKDIFFSFVSSFAGDMTNFTSKEGSLQEKQTNN